MVPGNNPAGTPSDPSESRLQAVGVGVVALLWGLQLAFLSPALALLLTTLFGTSVGQVSVVLVIYNAACLVAVHVGGKVADDRGNYRTLMTAGGVLTVALSLALLYANSITVGVAALVLLGAPAAVGAPLLFGYVRHTGADKSQVVRTRALFSTAWVIGPPLAAIIIAGPGPRALVLAIGLVGALNTVVTATLHRGPSPVTGDTTVDPVNQASPHPNPTLVLTLLIGIFAALQATNTAGTSIITLFTTETLNLSPVWGGAALGVAAAVEVPALLALARLYRQYRNDLRILSLASIIGIAYYASAAAVQNGPMLIAIQALNAVFYAVVAGVGLTTFQALIAGPGRASGMLSNSQRIGAILAGPLVALGTIGTWGLRNVFLGCAVVTLAALALTQVTERLTSRATR